MAELRFLKIVINNHPLIQTNTAFSLVSDQRVQEGDEEQMIHLFGRNWVNNITTLAGRNAAGKTTLMKFTLGMLSLLLGNNSITQTRLVEVLLGDAPVTVEMYFYGTNKQIYQDVLTFAWDSQQGAWYIDQEVIKVKTAKVNDAKKSLFNFTEAEVFADRSKLDGIASLVLSPDDSIFRTVIAHNKYQPTAVVDNLTFTDLNFLVSAQDEVPTQILEYLDSTVEYLKIDRLENHQSVFRLKFKGLPREITDNNFANITRYLSSGTAKGITIYSQALITLKKGGYLFIDELENHFNHAIVRTFIEMFADQRINQQQATLIFSTHYSALLDDLVRGDQVYIARRQAKITLTRYSDTDLRSDLVRSDVFDANLIAGTAPDYDAYMRLLKATAKMIAKAY
ncbi:MAG: ATP-binding protein [Lactobacillaceae bacterium]|nr:ATP-binding protein [Lactobacillaceae bacterium]